MSWSWESARTKVADACRDVYGSALDDDEYELLADVVMLLRLADLMPDKRSELMGMARNEASRRMDAVVSVPIDNDPCPDLDEQAGHCHARRCERCCQPRC